ncbi:MAG: HupE/UreJ family protein [Hyphomicrobiales bacterium]
MKKISTALAIAAATLAVTAQGFGPSRHDAAGFAHGFLHPLSGADHLLAMIAVGLFAGILGGRARRWLVLMSFMVMIAVGGAIGMAGYDVPFTEVMIAASVLALGAAVISSGRHPSPWPWRRWLCRVPRHCPWCGNAFNIFGS